MNFASLQHSVFLQALGSAILNSLWQGFILWIIYETVNVTYKSASSALKNKLSTLLIFFAFGWFLSSLITGFYFDEKLSPAAIINLATASTEYTWTDSFSIHSFLAYAGGLLPYLSVAYIFLLFFLMAKLLSSYRYVYFIANKRLVSPPVSLQYFAEKVAKQITITKKISVWLSDHIDVPATIGFLKPVILIPVASINNLSKDQLEAIILHELSHIKRNDYITNLLISVIETILFFNPFILLLTKVVRRERENCCDDFVIKYRYDPHSYASALLSIEQTRRNKLQLAMGAVSGKKQLLTRIKRMTNNNVVSKQFNYGQKLVALILVTGIIFSLAWLSPQQQAKKNYKSNIAVAEEIKLLPASGMIKPKRETEIATIDYRPPENKTGREIFQDHKLSRLPSKPNPDFEDGDLIGSKVHKLTLNEFGGPNNMEFYVDNDELKIHEVFFDPNVLQLIPLQALGDLSLQKLNIHTNIDQLNKGLKEAYRGINAMDWNKIQNEITESLLKIQADKLSEKKLSEFELYCQNAKIFAKVKTAANAKFNDDGPSARFRNVLNIGDSIKIWRTTSKRKLARETKKWPALPERGRDADLNTTYNYEYAYEPVAPTHQFRVRQKQTGNENITISFLDDSNVKIILEKLDQANEKTKKTYQYYLRKQSKNNSQQKGFTAETDEAD